MPARVPRPLGEGTMSLPHHSPLCFSHLGRASHHLDNPHRPCRICPQPAPLTPSGLLFLVPVHINHFSVLLPLHPFLSQDPCNHHSLPPVYSQVSAPMLPPQQGGTSLPSTTLPFSCLHNRYHRWPHWWVNFTSASWSSGDRCCVCLGVCPRSHRRDRYSAHGAAAEPSTAPTEAATSTCEGRGEVGTGSRLWQLLWEEETEQRGRLPLLPHFTDEAAKLPQLGVG